MGSSGFLSFPKLELGNQRKTFFVSFVPFVDTMLFLG